MEWVWDEGRGGSWEIPGYDRTCMMVWIILVLPELGVIQGRKCRGAGGTGAQGLCRGRGALSRSKGRCPVGHLSAG